MSNSHNIESRCNELKEFQHYKYHRNQSWEHCFEFFRGFRVFRGNEKMLNLAALQLGFFLASWGMFRGQSFLLQSNSGYYVPVIGLLIDSHYDDLWDLDCWDEGKQERNLTLLFNLSEELRRVMRGGTQHIGQKYADKEPSETLITKILMATMGCVPAYDRYFKIGLRRFLKENEEKSGANFSRKSFESLLRFSREDDTLTEIYRREIRTISGAVKYPPMRLLDYYFWRMGGGT